MNGGTIKSGSISLVSQMSRTLMRRRTMKDMKEKIEQSKSADDHSLRTHLMQLAAIDAIRLAISIRKNDEG